ncbi:hypothetical protein Ae201684P_016883 [Aphanomyces euteiches]|nr:hypothetical protein Ae201684P_016883 [Aphanomyces euteiches]
MDDFSPTSAAWADVVRVPQDDGPNPAVPINYTQQFKDIMDLFRAVLLSDEHSERTLHLTTAAIEENPANYTAFSSQSTQGTWNYQIWHHRREIVDQLNDSSHELEMIAEALDADNKNYHAWSYRQWVVQRFSLWDGELAFVDQMLLVDMRNNSAWNHRWFVIQKMAPVTPAIRAKEADFAIKFIRKAPHNESPWNYLRAWVRQDDFHDHATIKALASEIYDAHRTCMFAANMLVDLYSQENTPEAIGRAKEILQELVVQDPVRAAYWTHRAKQLPVC